MKVNLLILAICVLLGLGIAFYESQSGPRGVIQEQTIESPELKTISENPEEALMHEITFPLLDGGNYAIEKDTNPIIIINFWASWCVPCKIEFPHLLNLATDYPDHVSLLLVSQDENRDDITRFFNSLNADLQSTLSNENVIKAWDQDKSIAYSQFNTIRLPETYILNSTRQIIKKIIGAEADWEGEIVALIQQEIENVDQPRHTSQN